MVMCRTVTFILLLLFSIKLSAQSSLTGRVLSNNQPVIGATVATPDLSTGAVTDSTGYFTITGLKQGPITVNISSMGFVTISRTLMLVPGSNTLPDILLKKDLTIIDEVVVTGTMKEVSRLNSPIPVEIITPKLFQKNPTPSLFEAMGMVNGVRPQMNCNVCNTGDIHINGMEGPYTMILIDGMPIVSSLSTVYGLSGIPNSIVERIEVVKGPASSLYGSEAMGGIINVITKYPKKAPAFSIDLTTTSRQEYNADASVKWSAGNAQSLLGVSYFNYQHPIDQNKDGFTDVTLQNRVSVFNKWSLTRPHNRLASLAARYVYEDRWGGQMNFSNKWRGTDSIYGESIYTSRIELIGMYQLPVKEKIMSQFSFNRHDQNSYYGIVPFMAHQQVTFGQLYWDKQLGRHSILMGGALRYNYYDDNTPATASDDLLKPVNKPDAIILPGAFLQDEWTISPTHTLLLGYRYDYDKRHGNIHSPRLAYKWSPDKNNTVRASLGTGYRVVNLFTEDHAALTGARKVVIAEALKPERSYNANLNYVARLATSDFFINIDITGFYSYFTNKITGDFDTDPTRIIYKNLDGHAISKGISLNTDINFLFPLKVLAGISYMEVYQLERNANGVEEKSVQLHAPEWSGNFVTTYTFPKGYSVDLTGQWNGPMRLPILPNDYRPEYSPWYCIANIQLTKKFAHDLEIYGGVKNLFNFIPEDPIMRPNDPFNKHINDPAENPNGYIFDPSYNYASMEGIKGFLGLRWKL
jgi:outer membrane receptor for ferrienterochelin and colicins